MSGVGGSAKDYTGMLDAFVKIFKNEVRHASCVTRHASRVRALSALALMSRATGPH
jgi:hypothetical protein